MISVIIFETHFSFPESYSLAHAKISTWRLQHIRTFLFVFVQLCWVYFVQTLIGLAVSHANIGEGQFLHISCWTSYLKKRKYFICIVLYLEYCSQKSGFYPPCTVAKVKNHPNEIKWNPFFIK